MICPRCGIRDEDEDSLSGFCRPCAGEHALERYEERESRAADDRRRQWRESRNDPAVLVSARQRKHRLYAAVQPKQRPDPSVDPWVLAAEAIAELNRVRMVVKTGPARGHLAVAMERIRQLAVGPNVPEEPRGR